MKPSDRTRWESEYQEFLQTEPEQPAATMSRRIADRVRHDLQPTALRVFITMLVTYSLTGAFTLFFCPQYGIGRDLGVMSIFMRLGHHGCLLACGAFFLGSGTLMLLAVLRPEELRVAYRFQVWQIPAAALLLQALLSQIGSAQPLHASIFWLIGSSLGGLLVLQVGWFISESLSNARTGTPAD